MKFLVNLYRRIFKKINLYIAKTFLVKLLQIIFGFSLLMFFINFMDAADKIKGSDDAPISAAFMMAFMTVPEFLNDVISSLVLMSAIATFFSLSSKSEITVVRASGYSLWQILRPVAVCSFLIGIFWITIFNDLSIKANKKFNALEGQYVRNEMREVVAPVNGIWIKQANMDNPQEELVIQAGRIYKNNVELRAAKIWFFDTNGRFYQKIDANKMFLEKGLWHLKGVTINNSESMNKKLSEYSIRTDLEADFVRQKIVTNFQNVKLFSIFELPNLITDLESAGFSSIKFRVYLQSLLSKPLLFLAMVFIACFFGLHHTRNQTSVLMMFLGITTGLVIYITSSIINALGSSGLVPIFASTWVITLISLAVGILLIYKKENI